MNIESTAMSLSRRIWTRRDLFLELTKRDISERYSGSFFGLLWSFFNPLLMLCVYTFAFRELLGMRWPNQQSGVDFSLMIFCGLIVHSLMAECLMRGPGVIISQACGFSARHSPMRDGHLVTFQCSAQRGGFADFCTTLATLAARDHFIFTDTVHALCDAFMWSQLVYGVTGCIRA
jgi:ABC-type polysaccharide/polyol phosphate export permease